MNESTGSGSDVGQLREQLTAFRDAAVSINESLDVDTVLQGVLDNARELTGGRYGLLCMPAGDRQLLEILTSGMTANETEGFLHEMPDRWELYDFLIAVTEPTRIDDLQSYLSEHGQPEWAPPYEISEQMSFLAAPIRHSGEQSGVIYVAEKEPAFSAEDEETLVFFASLAAVVISNARRFEGERRAKADLAGLIATAPMIVAIVDAETGEVTSANLEARRLGAALGSPIASLEDIGALEASWRVDGRDVTFDRALFEDVLLSGKSVRDLEVIAQFPSGKSLTLMINAAPISGPDDDDVESVVIAAQDLTQTAERDQLQSEFLGIISHELRFPLAAIKGSATTALQGGSGLDHAEVTQFLRIIDAQADRMRDLLADLIDMALIETGNLSVSPTSAALAPMVEEARDVYAGIGGEVNIVVDILQDLPPVMADRRRIVQVLSNLLANATRNSYDGSVVRVEAQLDGGHVSVSVVDSGQGMSPDQIPGIFARFARAGAPDAGRDLGLGLAICKGIVEAHGGRIWASSDGPGLGSRFTFTLPTSDSAVVGQAAAPSAATPLRRIGEPVRVLAIDDDPRALKRVRDALLDGGYETTVTADPLRAGQLIAETNPHVVLLDLMLSGADGIELMQQILAICDAPVIFLSAYSGDELIARALELGASDYIVKPFAPTELSARIKAALRSRALQPRVTAPAAATAPSAEGTFEYDELTIDFGAQLVHLDDQPVELAPVEYRVLIELATNAGTLVTHDHLISRVWGPGTAADTNRLRTVIKNLRRKLQDDARNPRYIFTSSRIGYRMPAPERR